MAIRLVDFRRLRHSAGSIGICLRASFKSAFDKCEPGNGELSAVVYLYDL
jgi:hypothetical protein